MGLDGVELVMEVEATFAIAISDREAGGIVTVGQLFDCVVAKTAAERQRACLSRFSFYRLRRALVAVTGAARAELRPKTELSPLLPERGRRGRWRKLAAESKLQFPDLVRPRWLTSILNTVTLGIAAWCLWFAWPRLGFGWGAAAAGMALVISALGLYKLSSPWATRFNDSWQTLGGLTTAVIARNYAALSAERYQGTLAEIWATLVALISEQLGVDPVRVTPAARFVDDLAMD